MFDYAHADVRPWPTELPFGSMHTFLTDVAWSSGDAGRVCDVMVEHQAPGRAASYWRFRALSPLEVIVSEDERQATSLWARRDAACPGAQGFLLIKNSPVIAALLQREPHMDFLARGLDHYVLGTDSAVAHILCFDTPELSAITSPHTKSELAS
jgi:hypothetical protein